MASLKNITELPVAESTEGLNLIVNDNGAAKQIAASEVGAQADWNVEDESSPAFIKNKPEIVQADWAETDENSAAFIKNKPVEWDAVIDLGSNCYIDGIQTADISLAFGTYSDLLNKIGNGKVPKILVQRTYEYGDTLPIKEYYTPTSIFRKNSEICLLCILYDRVGYDGRITIQLDQNGFIGFFYTSNN